jgi:hypothetical protein
LPSSGASPQAGLLAGAWIGCGRCASAGADQRCTRQREIDAGAPLRTGTAQITLRGTYLRAGTGALSSTDPKGAEGRAAVAVEVLGRSVTEIRVQARV